MVESYLVKCTPYSLVLYDYVTSNYCLHCAHPSGDHPHCYCCCPHTWGGTSLDSRLMHSSCTC